VRAKGSRFWHTLRVADERQKRLETPNSDRDSEVTEVNGAKPREIGGPKGPEPTRFGDWERSGRCVDF
jgi:hypothetical protein